SVTTKDKIISVIAINCIIACKPCYAVGVACAVDGLSATSTFDNIGREISPGRQYKMTLHVIKPIHKPVIKGVKCSWHGCCHACQTVRFNISTRSSCLRPLSIQIVLLVDRYNGFNMISNATTVSSITFYGYGTDVGPA